MPRLRRAAAFLPLAFTAFGHAQSIALRFVPPLGKPLRYVVATKVSRAFPGTSPNATTQSASLTMTATSRKGGDTTVRFDVGATKANAGAKASSSTLTVDAYGRPKGVSAALERMGGVQGVAFPARKVGPGDSWTVDLDLSAMASRSRASVKASGRVPMRYKLKSVAKAGGRTIATIGLTMNGSVTMSVTGQAATLTMKSVGTFRVDAATGAVLDSHIVMDNRTRMGASGSFDQRSDVTMKQS